MTIYRVGALHMRPPRAVQMRHQLVAEQIEVHPVSAAATFRATKQTAVKRARGGQIMNRNGKMKRGQRHATTPPALAAGYRPIIAWRAAQKAPTRHLVRSGRLDNPETPAATGPGCS